MDNGNDGKVIKAVEGVIDKDRIISFSDAVFAFAATLLVLKIDLPQLTPEQANSSRLALELVNLWPSYLANIISFLVIAYYWLNHHAIFSLVKRFDMGLVWLNLIFLILIAFVPFPVDLLGDYSNSDIIVGFYCFSLSLVGFMLMILWIYARTKKLINPNLSKKHLNYYTARFMLAPLVFAISIPVSFVDPLLSKLCWIFVIIGIFVINKIFNSDKLNLPKESA